MFQYVFKCIYIYTCINIYIYVIPSEVAVRICNNAFKGPWSCQGVICHAPAAPDVHFPFWQWAVFEPQIGTCGKAIVFQSQSVDLLFQHPSIYLFGRFMYKGRLSPMKAHQSHPSFFWAMFIKT